MKRGSVWLGTSLTREVKVEVTPSGLGIWIGVNDLEQDTEVLLNESESKALYAFLNLVMEEK